MRRLITIFLPALLLALGAGCRTTQLLPPADFAAPGWHVQQGQAVWQPPAGRPELTGDLLLATNVNGNYFIQFSKIPFPIATAQVSGDEWQIKFGTDINAWHGRGKPSSRFIWFQLPGALRDLQPDGNWQFSRVETNSWRLKNFHTSEMLEGEFFP